jgi:nucleoside-diphosphate-sugar epimerase
VAAILRFGWFYGPGSDQTAGLIDAARSDVGPTCGPRDHWIGSLHLEDAATAVVAALGAAGGTYNVTDEPVRWGEFAEALGRAVAGEAPWLRRPGGTPSGDR